MSSSQVIRLTNRCHIIACTWSGNSTLNVSTVRQTCGLLLHLIENIDRVCYWMHPNVPRYLSGFTVTVTLPCSDKYAGPSAKICKSTPSVTSEYTCKDLVFFTALIQKLEICWIAAKSLFEQGQRWGSQKCPWKALFLAVIDCADLLF